MSLFGYIFCRLKAQVILEEAKLMDMVTCRVIFSNNAIKLGQVIIIDD